MSQSAGFSFKFSKSSRTKLTGGIKVENHANDDEIKNDDDEEEIEIKQSSEKKLISFWTNDLPNFTENTPNNKVDSDIVIPALANTLNLKIPNAVNLEDLAKNALIEDALRLKDGGTIVQQESSSKLELSVVENGTSFSADIRLDFSKLPDSAGEADYDAVPVEVYGKALLRGLGWKEGQPIGKSIKQTFSPVVTAPRPKGLGLGAEISKVKKETEKKSKDNKNEEELVLKRGVNFVTAKGEYGTIVGLDEDNARILGEMKLSKTTVSISQHGITLVTKEEYEKQSKIINKKMYDKYKNEEKLEKNDEKAKKSPKIESKSSKIETISPKNESKSSKNESKSSKIESKSKSDDKIWLFPDLKVRIIDEGYCKGKFYKQKVTVVDVASKDVCNCVAENGKILESLKQNQLETVIPRQENSKVMIVSGKYRGKLGILLERDSKKCQAVVKLIDDDARRFDFDNICEYVGGYVD